MAAPAYAPAAPPAPQPAAPAPQPAAPAAAASSEPSPRGSRWGSTSGGGGPFGDSYNQQPPPATLYPQGSWAQQQLPHANHGHQQPHRGAAGGLLSGTNNVPIGPSVHKAAPPLVIRPQMPQRPAYVTAAPQYQGQATSASAAQAAVASSISASVAAAAAQAKAAAAAAASKAPAAAAGPSQFPPSFTAWVTRCFNAAKMRGVPDAKMSSALMTFLDKVKAEGRLWTTDWDTHRVLTPEGEVGDAPSTGSGRQAPSTSYGGQQRAAVPASGERKRTRWGSASAAADAHAQDADTDEEDHGQHRGGGGSGLPSPTSGTGHQHQFMSNKQRKRLKHLEKQQQHVRPGAGAGGRQAHAAHPTAEELRRRARLGRFGNGRAQGAVGARGGYADSDDSYGGGDEGDDDDDYGYMPGAGSIVGTCQDLEKSYFRLTGPPDATVVRPEPVLERALARLVAMLARGEASYFYALDQFKGMRQDCTVQHLRNSLAARVYEAHARSCLEYGDLAEFNQCQARLGHLYADAAVQGSRSEFLGYRLLYETVHSSLGRGMFAKALLHTMRNVPADLTAAPEVRHAQQVREAVMTHNYAAFFRLYSEAPDMGRAIMDGCSANMRWTGLNAFVKACDPMPVPVAALAQLLGFSPRPPAQGAQAGAPPAAEPPARAPLPGCQYAECRGTAAAEASEEEGVEACAEWLCSHGAVVQDKGGELLLDCKASRGKLFIPEAPKVSHGDDNLSLTDFLSKAQHSLAGEQH